MLAVRSDAYLLTPDDHVIPNPNRLHDSLTVELDAGIYKFVTALDAHFPYGPPSLMNCNKLSIQGAFTFGADVICQGEVSLINESDEAVVIPDGAILSREYHY